MYVPREMVADIKLAEATRTSVGEYTRTTTEDYAKGLGYVGTVLAAVGTAGGSSVVQGVGIVALGGAYSLDRSPQNLLSLATGPLSKGASIFHKPFGEVIENIGYINDAITIACDIPLKC